MQEDPPARVDAPLDWRDYVGIFLISATLIVFQIAITRILSVVAWYHFAFLTISMVMLGLGAPGVWFALVARPQRWLTPMLLCAALALPGSAVLLVRFGAAAREVSILLLIAMVLPGMLALGAVVCLLLMRARGAEISRMYGVDLMGACLGAALIIPLLHLVPTPALVVGTGFLPLVALALRPGRNRVLAAVLAVVIAALIPTDLLRVQRSKEYDESLVIRLYEDWSPTARIAVFDWSTTKTVRQRGNFIWGRGENVPQHTRVQEYWLEQDGSAGTPITQFSGDFGLLMHLNHDVTTLGYQVRPRNKVVVIGAGGGRDILSALLNHAAEVDAVELNSHTIAAVSGKFGEFSGHVYQLPGVRAHAAEGRNFVANASGDYDLIQISLIDSWAASAAGAFALAENNLYTTEAIESYVSKLSETGVLSTSRWTNEFPRLIVLARAALERMHVAEPERHLMLGVASRVGTLLLSKRPFDAEDVKRFGEVCAQRGFQAVYPGEAPDTQPLLRRCMRGDYTDLNNVGLSTRAPTDDSPYFFQAVSPFADPDALAPHESSIVGGYIIPASTKILRATMFWVSGLAVALFFAPFARRGVMLVWKRRRGTAATTTEERTVGRELGRASFYFAAIGAGFMLLESMLIQRFVLYLGHPSYATTVVLAGMLFGMGLGSMSSLRIGIAGLRRFGFLVPLFLLLMVAVTGPLFEHTLGWPIGLRIALSLALLAPSGAVLGVFFPLGMLRFGDANKPWFWAINGAFGVVASVMSLALSMQFGFTTVGYASVGMYVVAWMCIGGVRQHDGAVGRLDGNRTQHDQRVASASL